MIAPKIYIIDVRATFYKRAIQALNAGKKELKVNVGLTAEDRRRIGNYKPLILSSPDESALALSRAYATYFNTSVEISYLLERDYIEVAKNNEIRVIWESLDESIQKKYRVAIFFVHP